jgi:SNF2 family DNA or RNA helicase
MILLDVIPEDFNYFQVKIKGNNFKDYLRIIQNIPSAEWDKKKYAWIISIFDYDILRKDLDKAKLIEIDVSVDLNILLQIFNNWKTEILKYQDYQDSTIDTDSYSKQFLMPHQKVAVDFSLFRDNFINGSECGTGKSLPSLISAILLRKNDIKNCLIICPATLVYNWQNEIQKFLPDNISSQIIEGNQEQREIQYRNDCFFTIVNYEKVGLDYDIFLSEMQFDLIIADELHRLRNSGGHKKTQKRKRTTDAESVIKLGEKAKYRIGISGTPLQNKIQDIYSIMKFINPKIFGGWYRFMQRYCIKGYFGEVSGYKNVEEINDKLKLIMFRRTKEQVLKDLPEKVYKDIYVELTQGQIDLYHEMKNKILYDKNDEQIFQDVLAKFVYLREICDSAELVDLHETGSSKIKALLDILDEIPKTSKVVIFSQWSKMIHIISKHLKEPHIIFTGEVSVGEKRDDLISEFNSSSKRLFLMTSAGGEGLNLQQANYLIFIDLPFNPQVIKQIEGRLDRIGQVNKMTIIRIITKNTVEDRVLEILKTKTDLFDGVIDGKSDIQRQSMLQEIKGILNDRI